MSGTGFAESQDCSGTRSFGLGKMHTIPYHQEKMHTIDNKIHAEASNDQASDLDGTITACMVVRLLTVSD